jgi:hypothetical protein
LQNSFTTFLLGNLAQIKLNEQFICDPSKANVPYHPQFEEIPAMVQNQLDLAFDVILRYLELQSELKELNISYRDIDGQSQSEDVSSVKSNDL